MAFWLRVVLAYLILAAGLIWVFGFDQQTGLNLIFLLAGFIPAIVNHTPRLYLALRRLQYWVTNANTTWDLSLEFRGAFLREQVLEFVQKQARKSPDTTRVVEESDVRFLIHYQRLFLVELLIAPPLTDYATSEGVRSAFKSLHVAVFDQQIAYRRSRRVLETMIVPFLEELKDALAPESGQYALRVQFDGVNPFLGLYLKQLRAEAVRDFQLEFTPPHASGQEYIRVAQHDMTVTAKSLEGFRRTILTGLTFGAALG